MKDLKYEHQSIKEGGWWGGWRVHGMGGCRVGGWRVHGVGAYTHPPMKLQCQNISFNEHPPTHQTYPVSIYYSTYTHPHIYIYFGWFMGWVSG